MRKYFLSISLFITAITLQAQTGNKSIIIRGGYQTKYERFSLGAEGRYSITDHIRIAPDVLVLFPKYNTTGFNINVNAHYVFRLGRRGSLFPFIGIDMINNYTTYRINTFSGSKLKGEGDTNLGMNIGGGGSYNISDKSFLDIEMKYTFAHVNYTSLFLGYGFRI